ncbi:hypothetical protein MTO96_008192 [Rhipicephalus appendiculatus]
MMEDGVLDLMCMETPHMGQVLRAPHDSAIVGDEAVMARLLGLQDRYAVTCDYCRRVQTEVQTPMRKTLALWMSEVRVLRQYMTLRLFYHVSYGHSFNYSFQRKPLQCAKEQCCEDSVFPTAMNLLDRYLSQVSVRKLHLQLLGCVCLLLASKMRQTRALAVEALVYYTDCSVTAQELQAWELEVLSRLSWDVASVVANDFVDHLVAMLGLADCRDTVRRHANTFISLCATEYHFVSYRPALLAASSVATAVHGLRTPLQTQGSQDELISTLGRITNVRTVEIRRCVLEIETLMATSVAAFQQQQQCYSKSAAVTPYPSCKSNTLVTPCIADTPSSKPNTPTDVQDINF